MKCSGEQPWCKTCRERSQPCVYEPNAGKSQPVKRKFPAAFHIPLADESQPSPPIGNPPSSTSSLTSMSTLTSTSSSDIGNAGWLPSNAAAPPLMSAELATVSHFTLQDVPAEANKRAATAANRKKRGKGRGKAKASLMDFIPNGTAIAGSPPSQIFNPATADSVGAHLIQLFDELWSTRSMLQISLQDVSLGGPTEYPVPLRKLSASLQAMSSDLVDLMCRHISPLGDPSVTHREYSLLCRMHLTADQTRHVFDPQPGYDRPRYLSAGPVSEDRAAKLADSNLSSHPTPTESRDAYWFIQLLNSAFETQPLLGLVVSKTIFLNDFGNRVEDKLLLSVIMTEALATQTDEAASSLSFSTELPTARAFQDSAYAMLTKRKTDSESAFITAQALVLLAFRDIQDGHLKRAICLLALCQKTTMWLLQDRQENPAATILVNGIALAELEDELLRNIYWLSRTASQWMLLHLGVSLSSELMISNAESVSVIPTLPPLRPSQSVVRRLDEVSGHFRSLKVHATSVAHLHVLSQLSEITSLLTIKLRSGSVMGAGRNATLSTERIATEFPHALLDAITSLDPIFEKTNPYSQLPHALRAIIVHLCFPSIRIGADAEAVGSVNLGVQALNHLLRVTVTALTQVASCLNATNALGPSAEGTPTIEGPVNALLELGFPGKHLGRAAPAIVHMLGAAARGLEIALCQSGLIQVANAFDIDVHAQFCLSAEASTFVVERKGQVLYLLQQMHAFLKDDALSCGSRRSVKKHAKMLAASLQARGVTPVVVSSIVAASSSRMIEVRHADSATPTGTAVGDITPKQTVEGQPTSSAPALVPTELPACMRPSTAASSVTAGWSSDSASLIQGESQATPTFKFTIPSQARTPPQTPVGATFAFDAGHVYGSETPHTNLFSLHRRGSHDPVPMSNVWSSPSGDSSLGQLAGQLSSSTSLPATPWSSVSHHWQVSSTPIGPSDPHGSGPLFRTPGLYPYLPAAFSHRPHTSMGPGHVMGGWEGVSDSMPMSVPATAPASSGWTTQSSPISSDAMLDTPEPQGYLPLMAEPPAEELLPCFASLSS
ncbi:hypothetical protein CF319_g4828 [Tilletia indica]|nr:hypothetical protein CF319_g4828 [Tilletia indica]